MSVLKIQISDLTIKIMFHLEYKPFVLMDTLKRTTSFSFPQILPREIQL